MSTTITQESPILVKAEVKLPWDDVSGDYNKVVGEFAGLVAIPGFRKGKAPAAIVKKRYRPQIISELAQRVIPNDLDKVIKENALRAVGQPRLSFIDLNEKEDLHYIAELDVMPEIELKDWKGIEAESLNIEISEDAVQQELEHRVQNAKTRDKVEDRASEEGDTIVVSLTAVDTAAEETLTDIERYELTIGADDAHSELSTNLIGKSVEDFAEHTFDAGDEDPFEEWRGKNVKVFMEVLELVRINVPALDDAFAKTQDAESLDDLREKTRETLLKSAEEREKIRLEGKLAESLIADYDFEVPESIKYSEARNQVESQLMPYMRQLGNDEKTRNGLIEQMIPMALPQAEQKIRVDVVLEKIAEAIEAEVSEEELDKELEQYLPYSGAKDLDDLKKRLEEADRLETPKLMLKRKKALEAVMNEAKINKVDKLSTDEAEDAVAESAEGSADTEDNASESTEAASTEDKAAE